MLGPNPGKGLLTLDDFRRYPRLELDAASPASMSLP
jgi:hypothetical protein